MACHLEPELATGMVPMWDLMRVTKALHWAQLIVKVCWMADHSTLDSVQQMAVRWVPELGTGLVHQWDPVWDSLNAMKALRWEALIVKVC